MRTLSSNSNTGSKLSLTALFLGFLVMSSSTLALSQTDRQGRPANERRIEVPSKRAQESSANGRVSNARLANQAIEDIKAKTQRGAAAVTRDERRTYSGPTERLSKTVRERTQKIITKRGRK